MIAAFAELQVSDRTKKVLVRWAVMALAAVSMMLGSCASYHLGETSSLQSAVNRPFGGTPAVDIPPSAYAMGAYLTAQMAAEDGQRAEALKDYEQAVRYDPHNAALHLELANLYVRGARLTEALAQAEAAVALEPDYINARLLLGGVSCALGDNATAQQQYAKVLEREPKNEQAYLFLGALYAEQRDYARAAQALKQLIVLDPASFLGYYYAGRVMAARKDYSGAEHYYQKALALNRQSQLVMLDLALLRELQARPKDAIALYQEVLHADPNNEAARKRLAELYGGDSKLAQAVAELQRQEELNITPADTRTKLGLVHFERGDFERAATEFNLVLGSQPDNYRVHYYLGTVDTDLGENQQAIDQFRQRPITDDHYVQSRLQLAYLYDKRNDYDNAIANLQDALQRKPNDTEMMGFLVGIYQEKKDYSDAIVLVQKMVTLQPRNDKFHFTLGALYDQNKQKELSASEMRKAIELNPSNAPALNYLGYSYAEAGQHLDEAEKLIRRALEIEPEDGFYVDSLGWVYYQRGQYQKAVDELEHAVNLTGNDPTITEHLGDAYNKAGKYRDARHEYADALKRAQDTEQIERLKSKLTVLNNVEQRAQH